jgi:hypothetical protein
VTPTIQQLHLAPELAVLYALDAALAAAARALRAEHETVGQPYDPDEGGAPTLRAATNLYAGVRHLRRALRHYRAAVRALHFDLGVDIDEDLNF